MHSPAEVGRDVATRESAGVVVVVVYSGCDVATGEDAGVVVVVVVVVVYSERHGVFTVVAWGVLVTGENMKCFFSPLEHGVQSSSDS